MFIFYSQHNDGFNYMKNLVLNPMELELLYHAHGLYMNDLIGFIKNGASFSH